MGETQPRKPDLAKELPTDVREVLEVLDEGKGGALVVLDMREVSGFTDFMVLCSGRSEPHVRALADAVEEHDALALDGSERLRRLGRLGRGGRHACAADHEGKDREQRDRRSRTERVHEMTPATGREVQVREL